MQSTVVSSDIISNLSQLPISYEGLQNQQNTSFHLHRSINIGLFQQSKTHFIVEHQGTVSLKTADGSTKNVAEKLFEKKHQNLKQDSVKTQYITTKVQEFHTHTNTQMCLHTHVLFEYKKLVPDKLFDYNLQNTRKIKWEQP